jgi:hypothetical protein
MPTRPALTQATAGFPASDAWWNAQVYSPLNYLYGIVTPASGQIEDTTSRTTTSTTYADAASGAFSLAVTVPASGNVRVDIRSTQRNSSTFNTLTSWQAVGSVSGTVYTANDTAALVVGGTSNQSLSLCYRLSGLSAGETLTVTLKHRLNSASTGTFDYRQIVLTSLL